MSNSRKFIKARAKRELEKKLSLEKLMTRDLNAYFEQLIRDYAVVYSTTGKVLNMNESYRSELNSLLKRNYRNISDDFSILGREAIEDNIDFTKYERDNEMSANLSNKIAMSTGAFLLNRALSITPKIADTIQNKLIESTNNYIIEQAKIGVLAKKEDIASSVSKELKDFSKNHNPVIATTEVQTVAEGSKYLEGKEIIEVLNTPDLEIKKRWITSLDDKVRLSHKVLDDVTIGWEELFITGNGSRMMYPGDMNNGAILSDVINCRCVAVSIYDNQVIDTYRNTIFRLKVV